MQQPLAHWIRGFLQWKNINMWGGTKGRHPYNKTIIIRGTLMGGKLTITIPISLNINGHKKCIRLIWETLISENWILEVLRNAIDFKFGCLPQAYLPSDDAEYVMLCYLQCYFQKAVQVWLIDALLLRSCSFLRERNHYVLERQTAWESIHIPQTIEKKDLFA